VNVAGKASTLDEAKQLAGWTSNDPFWLANAKLQDVSYARVIEDDTALDAHHR
jgi:hypothetical protein